MNFGFVFFFNSILLGIGLSMDAFSVSLANGLNEPCMKKNKMFIIAGTFAFFQALMPLIGWLLIHTIAMHFKIFEKLIPYIALILLAYIGTKMILDGVKDKKEENEKCCVGIASLLVQGIATSIDALSVGFTIADYNFISALFEALIIALVTFIICTFGVLIGKKAGTVLEGKASIFGGVILVFIGLEIFIKGIF